MKFEILRKANEQRDKEWNPENNITPSFRGLELAGEVGELCNVIKKYERLKLGLKGGEQIDIDKLGSELSDVIISTDLIAMQFGIDLNIFVPLTFNMKSYKHKFNTLISEY